MSRRRLPKVTNDTLVSNLVSSIILLLDKLLELGNTKEVRAAELAKSILEDARK